MAILDPALVDGGAARAHGSPESVSELLDELEALGLPKPLTPANDDIGVDDADLLLSGLEAENLDAVLELGWCRPVS